MKRKQLPETPPMTAKDLREYRQGPLDNEAQTILEDMLSWYWSNIHLLTNGEDYAFRREIGLLQTKLKGVSK